MRLTENTSPGQSDAALGRARQALHRFAAISFLDPRAASWEHLRQFANSRLLREAAAVVRSEPQAFAATLARGELPLAQLQPEHLLAKVPSSARELNEQYEHTFGLLVAGNCPPYETEYIHSKFTFQRSNALADVAGFYRAFGLELSSEHPDRHDHIVLELEFMACLVGREQTAIAKLGRVWRERRSICQRAQRRFLEEHLAWWAPTFAHLVARQAPGGFYEAAGAFLAALIPAERAMLNVAVPSLGNVQPSTIDRPEECEGCALAN